jgi:hypothetical protein
MIENQLHINYYNLSSSKDITFEMVMNSGIEIQNDVENCICYSEINKDCYHHKSDYEWINLYKLVQSFEKQKWSWSNLSKNPNITIDIVKKTLNNPNVHWDWKNITEYVGKCSLEIALLNPEIPWCWRSINNSCFIEDLENYLSKWCWISLSKNKNIYNAIIKDIAQPDKIKYREIRKLGWYFPLCIDEIREHSDTDKKMSVFFQKFLTIDRDYILRVINRKINIDLRLYRDINNIIFSYF